jgi:hypothetical protein
VRCYALKVTTQKVKKRSVVTIRTISPTYALAINYTCNVSPVILTVFICYLSNRILHHDFPPPPLHQQIPQKTGNLSKFSGMDHDYVILDCWLGLF